MKKILFVCNANMFRSTSSMYLMKKYLKENNIKKYKVDSAGVLASNGLPTSEFIIETLKKYGIDAAKHLTKKITQELCDKNDIIIVMSNSQKEILKNKFKTKSYLFNEIAINKNTEILDNFEVIENSNDHPDLMNSYEDQIISYINKNMPNLIKNLENF